MNRIIEVVGLSKSYAGKNLFRNLDLRLKPGQATRLMGGNGSGKTQFMMCLMGVVQPDSGKVVLRLGGEIVTTRNWEAPICYWGYLPYSNGLVGQMPLGEFGVLMRHEAGASLSLRRQASDAAVAGLPGGTGVPMRFKISAAKKLCEYSVGEQKRLGISLLAARLEHNKPWALILDEPLAGLDAEGRSSMIDFLKTVRSTGTALLIADHNPEIESVGFDDTRTFPFPAAPSDSVAEPCHTSNSNVPDGPIVFDLLDYQGGFPEAVVRCPELELRAGEVALVTGANGSGKSSFIKSLIELPGTVRNGRIRFQSVGVGSLSLGLRQGKVRYLDQRRQLYWGMTVAESLLLEEPVNPPNFGIITSRVTEALGRDKKVDLLSAGGRALLSLAQLYLSNPALAILDEPTANTDSEFRELIGDMIEELRNRGTAFVIVEHEQRRIVASQIWRITSSSTGPLLIRS